MRVALDEQIFAIQAYGGISRLFYEMARSFESDSSFGVSIDPLRAPIVNEYLLGDPALAARLQVTRSGGPYRALARYFTRHRRTDAVDVVHNTFYLPRGLSEHANSRRVVTVYDMIPELLPKTRRRLDFLTEKQAYVQKAHHIICISESTKRDLLRVYPEIQAPVTIAYPGVGPSFHPSVERVAGFPEPFILHVGNRSSYKDGVTLLRAFALIARFFPDYTLFLVGGGSMTQEESAFISSHNLNDRVVQRSLSDGEVPAAYRQADVTVFPSRYEGFGLPVVEAMACGSPLILADTSSLPEVGGAAAQYFEPGDDATLAALLSDVLKDSSQRIQQKTAGLDQAAKFTWNGYARANAEAYRAAAR